MSGNGGAMMNFGQGGFGNRFGGMGGGQFGSQFGGLGPWGPRLGGWQQRPIGGPNSFQGYGNMFRNMGNPFPPRTMAAPQPTGTDWNAVYQQMIGVGMPQSPAVSLNPSSQISPSGVPYTQGLLGSSAPPLGMGWANQIQQMQGGGPPPGYTGPIY